MAIAQASRKRRHKKRRRKKKHHPPGATPPAQTPVAPAPGASIVEQYNAGEDPHNLILERQGAVAFSYPTLDPGLTQRQTVSLAHGTWTLYCSLLDHKAGMQATLTVN